MVMKKILCLVLLMLFSISLFAFVLPEGTDARISDFVLDDEGFITKVYLSEPCEINTPIGKIEAKGEVLFNHDGNVTKITPKSDGEAETELGIIKYSNFLPISFYDSGCLSSLWLSDSFSFSLNDRCFSCESGIISFFDDWKPSIIFLDNPITIELCCGSVSCESSSCLFFHSNGNISALELSVPAEIVTSKGNIIAKDKLYLSENEMPLIATVESSSGIQSDYGLIYPVENSVISFYENGNINLIIPQDIHQISIDGVPYYTIANAPLGFDESGRLNTATIKGKKFTSYGWNIELTKENFDIVIYPDQHIYIPSVSINSINGNKVSPQSKSSDIRRILLDRSNCYYWKRDLESVTGSSWYITKKVCTIYKISSVTGNTSTVATLEQCMPSHFDQDGYFELSVPPLLFDDKNNCIGYRRAVTSLQEWDDEKDRMIDKANFNKTTDEYENYIKDIFIN